MSSISLSNLLFFLSYFSVSSNSYFRYTSLFLGSSSTLQIMVSCFDFFLTTTSFSGTSSTSL